MNINLLDINPVKEPMYNAVLSTVFSNEGTTEPVTLEEAKNWCRIDVADDDLILSELIKAARQICEDYVGLSFINRTVKAVIVAPNGYVRLPYGPVLALTTVTDEEGTVGVLNSDYTENEYGIKTNYPKAIVTYTAGYTILPVKLKIAILNQIAFMYENRGDAGTISPAAKQALKPLRNV